MRLLYDINSQEYFVMNITEHGGYYLYKVDNFNPPMLSRVIDHGNVFLPGYKQIKIIEEMGEFALKEFKKINSDW